MSCSSSVRDNENQGSAGESHQQEQPVLPNDWMWGKEEIARL